VGAGHSGVCYDRREGTASATVAKLTGAEMSVINDTSEGSTGIRVRIDNAAWIHSPAFDIFLLICAPLATLPIFIGIYLRIPVLAIGGALGLAFTHYASTISFYFWNENKEYYRSRWLAFFGGPLILGTVYFLLIGFAVPFIIQVVVFVWNTWHVSRQNCGILSLYRSRAGVSNLEQKNAANNAIIALSFFLAFWNINSHEEVMGFFGWFSKDLSWIVKIVLGAVATFYMGRLGIALLRREQSLGIPESLFLAASLGFFYPYLFIKDSGYATLAMLLPHYVQYLALVWLLHRRKFGTASEGAPLALRKISSKTFLLIPALFAFGSLVYLFREYTVSIGHERLFEILYLFVALEHFYLDGLIWSFRRPHVRQTMLPFLLRRPAKAPS
jgi:hypothetical protein